MTLLFAALLALQDPKPPIVLQRDIDDAIKRGADWLLASVQAGLPESPFHGAKRMGHEGLVLYTLMHAGIDRKDARILKLVATIKSARPRHTYQAATNAIGLQAYDTKGDCLADIAVCAQYLVDTQAQNGQWGYGEPYDIQAPVPTGGGAVGGAKMAIKRNTGLKRPPNGDNSNSQYAALGLWACEKAGFDIENTVLEAATKWWEGCQREDGSWGYCDQGKFDAAQGSYGSMTAGGASSIVLLRQMRGSSAKTSAVNKAITWLGAQFAVDKNPAADSGRQVWHFYYLYALERCGDLLGLDKIGKWAWYWEGADWLVKNQKGGQWSGQDPRMVFADTCFAILFLERAMRVTTGVEKK